MAQSPLLPIADDKRKTLVARNRTNTADPYGVNHPDAISDGDELGKGENNGEVGSSIDIAERKRLIATNDYSANNRYKIDN